MDHSHMDHGDMGGGHGGMGGGHGGMDMGGKCSMNVSDQRRRDQDPG